MRVTMIVVFLLAFIAPANAAPAGCPKRLWCGCYLMKHLGLSDRALWLAKNWLRYPRAPLAPGNVAVFSRGRGGHVGKIVDVKPGKVLLHSGNDGNSVRTRWRSTRGLIAAVSVHGSFSSQSRSRAKKIRGRSTNQPPGASLSHGVAN